MLDKIMELAEELSISRKKVANILDHSKREERVRSEKLTDIVGGIEHAKKQLQNIDFSDVTGVDIIDDVETFFSPSYDNSYQVQEEFAKDLISVFSNMYNKACNLQYTLSYLIDNCTFVRDSTATLDKYEKNFNEAESVSFEKIEAKLYAAINDLGRDCES